MKRNGIIIGGGAAGLMAGITAAEHGAAVTILEHMPRTGKKILSTGNGKCNLTNTALSAACYRSEEADFPMQVLRRFPPKDTIRFFRSLGVLTLDRGGYIYPCSEQARTVLDALRDRADELGVETRTEITVRSIARKRNFLAVDTDQGPLRGEFVILCTGSMAAKSTGSDGSGYALAQALGHSLIKPLPALVQLRCKERFFPSVAGVRTEAGVALFSGGKCLAEDRGELQLTDYGISGIPVFQVSRYAARMLDQGRPVTAVLDLFPRADTQALSALLREQTRILAQRNAGGFLTGFFNKKLADLLLKQAGIRPTQPVQALTRQQLSALCGLIKHFEVQVTAVNPFEQAQVCSGGIRTTEVSPETMESRLVKGLYFAGEILDVDGICGGYNLQWAWASGHLAGSSAAAE